MKYLLLWGECDNYQYENYYETYEEALGWLNQVNVQWNQLEDGYWYKLYKQTFAATESEWGIANVAYEHQ